MPNPQNPNDDEPNNGPPNQGGLPPSASPGFGGYSSFPSGAETLGQPMYPWLQRWSGPFSTPMSGYENQALQGMSQGANRGFGLGQGRDYLNDVLQGDWLHPNNQYFDQIESMGGDLLRRQQDDTLARIASSMAAGGTGLSGARTAAEGRYLTDSNQSFNQMMAQLRADQYARERGYMQEAPGMLSDLSGREMQGYGQLFGMGALPRQISDREIQGQYQDWLRQIGSLEDAYHYPDQLSLAFLGANRYPGYQNQQYGNSTLDNLLPLLATLFGAGGENSVGSQIGSALGNLLGGLGGGGNQGGGQGQPNYYNQFPQGGPGGGYGNPWEYEDPIGPTQPGDGTPFNPYDSNMPDDWYDPQMPEIEWV